MKFNWWVLPFPGTYMLYWAGTPYVWKSLSWAHYFLDLNDITNDITDAFLTSSSQTLATQFDTFNTQFDTFKIIPHNTQGLTSHIEDIRQHHELTLSDVLCLTETKLSGSNISTNLNLEGYNMFNRNRHTSYQQAKKVGGLPSTVKAIFKLNT